MYARMRHGVYSLINKMGIDEGQGVMVETALLAHRSTVIYQQAGDSHSGLCC